jgi:hypothetical protein
MNENPHTQKFVEIFGSFSIFYYAVMMLCLAVLILLLMDNNAYAQSIDSSSDTVPLSAFIGTWENNNSKGISKAEVLQVGGGPLQVRLFGACVPDYCDWGIGNATYEFNKITSTYSFLEFKNSSATLSLTNDGKLRVEVANHFSEDNSIGRSNNYTSVDILSRSAELDNASNEPILGVPYPITLSSNGTNGTNIEYKVRLSFLGEDNKYNISSVDKGAFDSYNILSQDTVVFYTRELLENESKTGIVVFQFENGSAEKHRQLKISANVTTTPFSYYNNDPVLMTLDALTPDIQGASLGTGENLLPQIDVVELEAQPTGSIQFTVDASFFGILISVTKTGSEVFKLAGDIYDRTTPCASLEIQNADTDFSSPVVYNIDINNCSAHPQKVRLTLTQLPEQGVSPLLSKKLFDISANTTDSSILRIHVPASMPDDFYVFEVHADVMMNVFGKEYVVSSSLADEAFQVNQPRIYP